MTRKKAQYAGTELEIVRTLAYELWEEAGSPAGRDAEFWLKAESKVREFLRPAAEVIVAETRPDAAFGNRARS